MSRWVNSPNEWVSVLQKGFWLPDGGKNQAGKSQYNGDFS